MKKRSFGNLVLGLGLIALSLSSSAQTTQTQTNEQQLEDSTNTSPSELDESILSELDQMHNGEVNLENMPAPTSIKVRRVVVKKVRPEKAANLPKTQPVVEPSTNIKSSVKSEKPAVAVKLNSSKRNSNQALSPTIAQTSGTLVNQIDKKEKENSSWNLGYTYWASANTKKLHEQTAEINGLNIVSLGYKLSNGIGLAVEPTFFINYNLEQGNTKHLMGNTTLKATKGNLAKILGFDLSGALRFYLPTGEGWRKSGTNGALRTDLTFSRDLGSGFSTYYLLQPRFYMQSDRSSAKFDEYGRLLENAKANYGWRAINEVGIGYEFNKVLSVGQSVGIDYLFNYDDPGVGVDGANTSTFDLGTSLSIAASKNFNFTLAVSQSHELQSEQGFSLFNTEEMAYHGIFSLSL